MRVLRNSREELDREAVDFAVSRLSSASARSGQAVLGLPGGRSVSELLQGLSRAALPWESVHFFLADERRVPPDSPDSNFKEINDLLISPLRENRMIPAEHIHPCTGGAADYSDEFSRVGSRFDLLVLGAGEDGHIASLFPHHAELTVADRPFVDVHNAPKPPPERVSATRSLIRRSGAIVLLFFGEAKRQALHRFLDDTTEESECPARITRSCADLLVLTDQPADD
jgi:6-phosphogluconolactonase